MGGHDLARALDAGDGLLPTGFSGFGAALTPGAALAAGTALAIARGLAAERDATFAGAVRGRWAFGDADEAGRAEA